MKSSFIKHDEKLKFLSDAYSSIEFELYTSIVDPGVSTEKFMSAIVCKISHQKSLSLYWEEISSLISVEYQSKLNEEYSRWNIYLLFLADCSIENQLKYKVENDTFFVRKLVIDNVSQVIGERSVDTYLNCLILGDDLISNSSESKYNEVVIENQYSLTTQRLISEEFPLTSSEKDKKQRIKWLKNELSRIEDNEI
ncbi:MAG: hypothetical protein ACJAXS_002171 [Colwellia sp.]|jgi:hypothetical protein